MSMTGEYHRLTATSLEDLLGRVRHDPEAFSIYLYSELRRFDKRDSTLSIGKGWHGIHFVLNGDPDEINSLAGSVVYGGQEVGADMSYGPVRYMTPSQVQNVSKALEAITEEEFKARFDPAAFRAADIYSGGDWSHPNDLPWLWERFSDLRNFFREGAGFGEAILLYIA